MDCKGEGKKSKKESKKGADNKNWWKTTEMEERVCGKQKWLEDKGEQKTKGWKKKRS